MRKGETGFRSLWHTTTEKASEGRLLGDLKRMLRDESFTDIVFLCGDPPEEVPTCRMLVAVRSPVLEAMLLKAGMRESTQTRIALPEIDAETMRLCLEFFYTDSIKQSTRSPQHEIFVKVIAASKFLLTPELEQVALSCLRRHIENTDFFHITGRLFLDTVKAYTRGVDILHAHSDDMHDLPKMLCDMASSVELTEGAWPWESLKYLSQQALAHLVQSVHIPSTQQTLWEYFLFVKVVMWCAYQLVLCADDPIAEEKHFRHAIDEFLPGLCTTTWRDLFITAHKRLDVESLRVFKLLKKPLAECLEHVPVKLYKKAPLILSRNIEPLGLLSTSALLSTYRVQALSRVHMRWDEYGHHENYGLWTDGTVTCCTSEVFAGMARGSTGIERDILTNFEWEIEMIDACDQLRVGFCISAAASMTSMGERNAEKVGDGFRSWALSTDGHLYYHHRIQQVYCDAFSVSIGLGIRVHLTCKTFAFSVNGSKGAKMLLPQFFDNDFQDVLFYPAISMVKPGKARIQMVVQDWMEHPPQKELLDPDGVEAEEGR